jgi:hypothetical protein
MDADGLRAALDEMREILEGCAKRCETITYSQLAPMIGMHHRAPEFHHLLDLITDPGKPSLATLVVRKDSGIPGAGYFAGTQGDVANEEEQRAYWQARLDELCAFWADA